MRLTKKQRAVLVGTLLGDGYLQKTGVRNARLRLEHSQNQKEYLLWKVKSFGPFFQGKPTYLERKHPKSKLTYRYVRAQSQATPELGKWRKLFYPDGKKKIPGNLDKLLKDGLSLAVWYMDDGYYYERDKNSYLYLGRVSKQESEIVKNSISKNFGISVKVYDKKNKGYAIFFNVEETKKLHRLLKVYIIKSMQYKIAL